MMSSLQCLKKLVEKKHMVAVLDDFFPNLLTGFRVAEYNCYLEHFPQLKIYSTNPDFEKVHAEYVQYYPQYADRVKPYDESVLEDCTFAYINFLNNVHFFLPALSVHCIPFLMTLYPGGGFGLGEPESDEKLEQIIWSPLLYGIIATQSITLDYLKGKGCTVPVHFIYGGAVNPLYFESMPQNIETLSDGCTIRICFVAVRYMSQGANKGYPQFIESAKQLIREFPDLRFSVVGNFGVEDIVLDDQLKLAISFNGPLTGLKLKEFFLTQDMIISPNSPFLLHPGNFDGFPTGSCVEASLCGATMVCSDELKLNRYYTDGVDIVICKPKPEAIVNAVRELIRDPVLLKSIGERGQAISQKIFCPKKQLGMRIALLDDALKFNESKRPIKLLNHLKLAKQSLVDQSHQINTIKAELAECRQHITTIEQIIANHVTNIRKLEADWTARGKHIVELEQSIGDKNIRIHNIETELTKFQMSWCGKLKAASRKLHHLLTTLKLRVL